MRLALAPSLLLAPLILAGCTSPATWPVDARFGLLPERFRRDPATVPRTGAFAEPAAARTQAQAQAPVPAEQPAVRGRVVGAPDGGADGTPIAGALVGTSDGRSGLTDADGRFAIPGAWPADGGLAVSHPDWIAAAITVPAERSPEGPELRLAPRAIRQEAPAPVAARPFAATGRVVGPDGAPVEGVLVTLGDAGGAFAAPVASGADGRFTLTVFAAGQALTNATLVALGAGAQAWAGVAGGKAASPDAPELGDVAVALVGTLVVPAIDGGALPDVPVRAFVALVAADGTSLDLPRQPDGWRIGAVAGAGWELRAEAIDAEAGVASELRQPLDPADAAPRAVLLAPPGRDLDPALVLNEGLSWGPVPGARVYETTLATLEGRGILWQGRSAAPAVTFSLQEPLEPGTYGLSVTAWDVPDPAAPGRTWRRASRQARVTLQ